MNYSQQAIARAKLLRRDYREGLIAKSEHPLFPDPKSPMDWALDWFKFCLLERSNQEIFEARETIHILSEPEPEIC